METNKLLLQVKINTFHIDLSEISSFGNNPVHTVDLYLYPLPKMIITPPLNYIDK